MFQVILYLLVSVVVAGIGYVYIIKSYWKDCEESNKYRSNAEKKIKENELSNNLVGCTMIALFWPFGVPVWLFVTLVSKGIERLVDIGNKK